MRLTTLLAGALVLALAACAELPQGGAPGASSDAPAGAGAAVFSGAKRNRTTETVELAGGEVVVGGPRGYCVDRSGSQLLGDPAFVLLADCMTLTGDPEFPTPRAFALLTASVEKRAKGDSNDLEALKSLLRSPEGRAALARDGRADSVRLQEIRSHNGALILHVDDQSNTATPTLEQDYWRAFFNVNGRLVTVTVNAFAKHPINDAVGRALVQDFAAEIRDLSPTGTEDTSATSDAQKPNLRARTMLRRLFR